MTTQQLYKDFNVGKISKNRFLYEIKRDPNLKNWITTLTSLKDSIRILRNKGLITENVSKLHEVIDDINVAAQEIIDTLGDNYDDNDIEVAIASKYDDSLTYEDKEKLFQAAKNIKEYQGDFLAEDHTSREAIIKFVLQYHPKYMKKGAEISDLYSMSQDELNKLYNATKANAMSDSGFKDEYIKFKDQELNRGMNDRSNGPLFEAKKVQKQLTADNVNFYEYQLGIKYELECKEDYSDMGLEKAKIKVLKNLSKEPNYYSKELYAKKSPYKFKEPENYKSDKTVKHDGSLVKGAGKNAKDNVKDTLGNKEKGQKNPKGIKQMTVIPKKSKGVKVMEIPGKEKKIKLKEFFDIEENIYKNEIPDPKFFDFKSKDTQGTLHDLTTSVMGRAEAIKNFASLAKSGDIKKLAWEWENIDNNSSLSQKEAKFILDKFNRYDQVIDYISKNPLDEVGEINNVVNVLANDPKKEDTIKKLKLQKKPYQIVNENLEALRQILDGDSELEVGDSEKRSRYTLDMDFYIYAKNDEEAKLKSEQIREWFDNNIGGDPQINSLYSTPFASLSSKKIMENKNK